MTARYHFLKKAIKFLGILSILATIAFVVYLFKDIQILQNPDALTELLRGKVLLGAVIFFFLQVIQVVIPIIPGGVTTVVGFMAFGPFWGFVLNYSGIIIGSIVLFALTRYFGKMFILLFIDERIFSRYERKLTTPSYEKFFILNMLSPISPADILVMITGLSNMSYSRFVKIILVCKPISIFAYSYFWIYGGHLIRNFL